MVSCHVLTRRVVDVSWSGFICTAINHGSTKNDMRETGMYFSIRGDGRKSTELFALFGRRSGR